MLCRTIRCDMDHGHWYYGMIQYVLGRSSQSKSDWKAVLTTWTEMKAHVLLVEDNERVRIALAVCAKKVGPSIQLGMDSPEEALEEIRKGQHGAALGWDGRCYRPDTRFRDSGFWICTTEKLNGACGR